MIKNKRIKLFSIIILLLLIASKGGWAAMQIDMAGFNMLPPHCQARYAEMYKKGQVEGIVINPEKYQPELWEKRVGHATFIHFHHYCGALKLLNDLKFGKYKTALEKNKLMEQVSSNIKYTIEHSKLDTQNAWVLAEAHLKLAEFEELVNKNDDAVNLYKKSIEINPRYIQAYAGLSDIYKKMGMNSEAKAVLEKAIKIKPNSKGLLKRLAKLEK